MSTATYRLNFKDGLWVGSFSAMASDCEVLMHNVNQMTAHQAIALAQEEALRIEKKYSRYRKDNLIWKINNSNGKPVEVDAETAQLLDYADQCYQISDGLFDVTSGSLGKAWNFKSQKEPPSETLIKSLLSHIGWHKVKWKDNKICLEPGMMIDLGGIGKEYAVDRVCQQLKVFTSSNFLVNFGGDLCIQSSAKPNTWKVGIENFPGKIIKISQGAIATSGKSKRYFIYKGKRYSHILNPKTGWPIENAPLSITVLSNTATQAGILATIAQLQGKGAENFLKNQNVKFWSVK